MIPRWFQLAGLVLAALALSGRAAGAEFQDAFADREVLTTAEGRLSGDNTVATVESGEPRHGGKAPRHSVWISWIAPVNGLATLRLTGAGYDTLLAVYQVRPDEAPDIRRLDRIVENDDDDEGGDDEASSGVQFGVQAGERVEIAVDGYAGATGPFVLEWHLEPVDELIPRIQLVTGDRAARIGDRVILETALGDGDEPKLHWEFNGDELEDEEELTLVIPSFQESHVGRYRVRVEIAKTKFFSAAVELQISSEGIITALARNKPEDALESPLSGAPPAGAPVRA
ncbi:MAG: immunoglobulin domain-containing protein, partial [Verrucomicrobia bacterium]|nr:immunoglobulin domain-containing protein [Verrucomicrobiota bacterium]